MRNLKIASRMKFRSDGDTGVKWMRGVGHALLTAGSAAVFALAMSASSAAGDGTTPFGLTGTHIVSPDGVSYTMYSGKVPWFDGLPLDVDVTIPDGYLAPGPLLVMMHGWAGNKTDWESPTVTSNINTLSDWNNVAFASRGYAVINYTERGFGGSCGPSAATVPNDPTTLPPACITTQYWTHAADPQWEIHDAQHLIGEIVDEGFVSADKVGVDGFSHGSGHAWLLALLNDRIVNMDGTYSPWITRSGIPVHIAAAVPRHSWASLADGLVPNGRAVDSDDGAINRSHAPVGMELQSWMEALYWGGKTTGFYAPPGEDPTADLDTWFARLRAGNPYRDDATDPIVHTMLAEFDRRSPLYITPTAPVPVFQIQGTRDAIFSAAHAVRNINHLRSWERDYPIKTFLGDMGHWPAVGFKEHWAVAHAQGHAFLDYYLKGIGAAPEFDVTVMTSACVEGQTPSTTFTAPTWSALENSGPSHVLHSNVQPRVDSEPIGTSAWTEVGNVPTDPVIMGEVNGAGGCQTILAAEDMGVPGWNFPVDSSFTLLGTPRIQLSVGVAGIDAELNVRIWDVSPPDANGLQQMTLVSRGTYHYVVPLPIFALQTLTFESSANAWLFGAGHSVRLEVTGNDFPSYQMDNVPSVTTIKSVDLTLPSAGPLPAVHE